MFGMIGRGFRELAKLVSWRRELEQIELRIVRGQLSTQAMLVDLALLDETVRKQLPFLNADIDLQTDHPLAVDSSDHSFPRGSATDFTRCMPFVLYCERLYGGPLKYLDLGCSGGGIVFDFLLRRSVSIGLEGSDFSLRQLRAAWRVIPSNLFTCDICSPYKLQSRSTGERIKFDVIGAWEVLEHIPEALIPAMLRNVVDHMHERSLFMGSIATFPDEDRERGIVWHVTIKSRDWWLDKFRQAGLELADLPYDPRDMPRGAGNGPFDWSALANPEMGFHVILKKIGSAGPGSSWSTRRAGQ
jgi:2-polyprenyl-3-methyl-5-hydroxy-6-metoxy-1,4-benzoquinol methylase